MHIKRLIFAALVIIVGASGTVAIGALASYYLAPDKGALIAAWIQAIGSIAAIVGAWWLSQADTSRQRELEKERIAREELNLYLGALSLVTFAAKQLEATVKALMLKPAPEALLVNMSLLEANYSQIDQFPAHRLPDHHCMMLLVQTAGSVKSTTRLLENLRAAHQLNDPDALSRAYGLADAYAKQDFHMILKGEVALMTRLKELYGDQIMHPSPQWYAAVEDFFEAEEMG